MAVDGIVGAKYLITQLGTPYSKRDCIHAAVIDVIRTCSGGVKNYRTAGCTALWNSIDASSKYRDITERMSLAEAKEKGLLIGDLPVIYNEGTGKCEHIAYYMGGVGGYECLHSSATKGELCATTLKNGFTHILRHRYITGRLPSDYNTSGTTKNEVTLMNVLYHARVSTNGGALNLRASAKKASGNVLCEIPFEAEVGVLDETNRDWTKVQYDGFVGYVASQYLTRIENVKADIWDDGIDDCGSWGVFIPCATREEANIIRATLACGRTMQDQSID